MSEEFKEEDPTKEITELIKESKEDLPLSKLEWVPTVKEVQDVTNEVFSEISGLSLITESDVKKLQEAKEFALSTYTDVPQYAPMVTKLTSILTDSSFPTSDKKYWQCKAQAEVHYNELQRAMFKYEKALVDLEEIDYKITVAEKLLEKEVTKGKAAQVDPVDLTFAIRRLQVKRKLYAFESKQLEKNVKFRIKEVTEWHTIAEGLKDKLEFDPKNHDEHYGKFHYILLESKVRDAKTPKEKKVYQDQLDTFKRILDEWNSKN